MNAALRGCQCFFFFAALLLTLPAAQSPAATVRYVGFANGTWTAPDWETSGGVPISPDGADDAIIGSTSTGGSVKIISTGIIQPIRRIEMDKAGASYRFEDIFNGSLEIYLTGGNALWASNGGGTMTFDTNILLREPDATLRFNIAPSGETITVNGDVAPSAVTGTTELLLTSAADPNLAAVIVDGVISDGPGSTLKLTAGIEDDAENHDGLVKLGGLNTYSGQTVVNGAVLEFNSIADSDGSSSALGAPDETASPGSGTIRLGATDTSSSAKIPGTLRYTGSGHSSNRDFDLQGGGGIIEADAASTGSLELSGVAASTEAGMKVFELGGDSSSTNTFSGGIVELAGQVSLAKTGATTWVLTAGNVYEGGTTIGEGTLSVSSDINLGAATGDLSFTGGTLRVTGTTYTSTARNVNWQGGGFDIADPNHTFEVSIGSGGSGALTKVGAGSLKLTGTNSIQGAARINEGSLHIADGDSLSNSFGSLGELSGSNGTATVNGTGSQWNSGFLLVGEFGEGTLNVEAGGVVSNSGPGFLGSGSGSTGTATVTGVGSQWINTSLSDPILGALYVGYGGDGTLNIEAGGVVSNTDGWLGFASGSTGTVTVTGVGSQWNMLSALDVGYDGDGTLNVEAGGVVSNKDGFLGFFSGSTGTVTVTGAGSQWNNSGSLYVGGRNLSAGGLGTLNIDSGGEVIVADTMKISDTGTVNLQGGTLDVGTLDLTVTGNTFSMSGGRLEVETVAGDLNIAGGTLAPGESPGLTTISGDFIPQTAATLEIEIGGITAQTQYDVLDVTGTAMLGGTLDLSLIDLGGGTFAPSAGDTFEIVTATTGVSGTFDAINWPALSGDLMWYVNYGATSVELVSTYAADFDEDGDIDELDYAAWESNFGSTSATHMTGDANADAAVNGFDFLKWQQQFGIVFAPDFASTMTVPEPSTFILAIMTGLLLSSRKRRIAKR